MGVWENYSTNAYSEQYKDEQKARDQEKRAAASKMKAAEVILQTASQEVDGLCPKKCSCETCRNARMSDETYMELVHERNRLWGAYESLATIDNAIAHSVI